MRYASDPPARQLGVPEEWSAPVAGDVSRARHQALGDIPRRTAARVPGKCAIVHRDTRLTFAEFDAIIDQYAAAMHAAGLRKGDKLALLSHNCWQFAVLAFATARLGVVLVPINFMLTGEEIAYILDDCAPAAFVVEDRLLQAAQAALVRAATRVELRVTVKLHGDAAHDGWIDIADWASGRLPRPPEVAVADDDLIRIMYTSGTESRPKGAMLTSRSLMWQYISCIVTGEMSAGDVEVHALPLYHCAQLDNFLITDVYLGATSIILDGPDPSSLLQAIKEHHITNMFAPPTVWIALLRHPLFEPDTLSSLRKGYYGASALPLEILHEMQLRLPSLRLWNFYGQTEMASLATALGPDDQTSRSGSAGLPALNVETRVVDESGQPVPAHTVGEIVHRSPHATIGYYNNPEKTAESFGHGWFHSGDLGYFDEDGYLWVVDRKKDMIKTGGENVASREVEEVIYRHPAVTEASVFSVPHPKWVEAVAAAIVLRDEHTIDERELLEHCRQHLAGFKVPKFVFVVDALPKNPSGKILKRELRDHYARLTQA